MLSVRGQKFFGEGQIFVGEVKILLVKKKWNTRVHFSENGGICEHLYNLYI